MFSHAKSHKKYSETHEASLGEFELAKEAREIGREELLELKAIAKEIHAILRDVKKRLSSFYSLFCTDFAYEFEIATPQLPLSAIHLKLGTSICNI